MKRNDTLIGKFELFLLTHARYSANTCLAYSRDVQQFNKYLIQNSIPMQSLDRPTMQGYMKFLYDLGLATSSRARKVESLRTFLDFLADHCGLPHPGFGFSKIKVEKKLPVTLEEPEIKALLQEADRDQGTHALRNRLIVYLLYATGLRVTELMQLQRNDVSLYPPLLKVRGKGGKERLVPYSHSCIDMMKEHIATLANQYLFVAYDKKDSPPMNRVTCARILQNLAYKAGIKKKINPHLLRHTYATHMLLNGANVRQIQTLLGHEHISSTQIYTYLNMQKLREEYDKKNSRA